MGPRSESRPSESFYELLEDVDGASTLDYGCTG